MAVIGRCLNCKYRLDSRQDRILRGISRRHKLNNFRLIWSPIGRAFGPRGCSGRPVSVCVCVCVCVWWWVDDVWGYSHLLDDTLTTLWRSTISWSAVTWLGAKLVPLMAFHRSRHWWGDSSLPANCRRPKADCRPSEIGTRRLFSASIVIVSRRKTSTTRSDQLPMIYSRNMIQTR